MFDQRYICDLRGHGSSSSLFLLSGLWLIIPDAVQEMFIQYLAEQGHNVVKSERKPRKTIQYKDLGQLLT